MLSQLKRLSIETDGRFATADELQFLRNYLATLDQRVSAYQKIQAAEEAIIQQVESNLLARNPEFRKKGSRYVSSVFKRDIGIIIRNSAAVLLINDLERLRDCVLLWHQTIIRAFKVDHISSVAHPDIQEVIKPYLTSQEAALLKPILELNINLLN